MCGRGNRAKGRATEDVLMGAIIQQIGEVGCAAAELAHGQRIVSTGQLAAQERLDCAFVKALIDANADRI